MVYGITINQSINDVDRRRLNLSLYVLIVLKTSVLVSNNSSIKLGSISGTGKVGSVINFHILELPKVIKSRIKYFNRVNINYSIRQTVPNINYSISEREYYPSKYYPSTEKNRQVYPVWCSRLHNHTLFIKKLCKKLGAVQILGKSSGCVHDYMREHC